MLSIKRICLGLIVIFSTFLGANCVAPALYVFGDSLFDSGNNNWLPTLAKANFDPYGHNFPQGPTGRFTNGRHVADIIAEYLGLPYPPPYVMPFRPNDLIGYNFASGACGILPETGKDIRTVLRKYLTTIDVVPRLPTPILYCLHIFKRDKGLCLSLEEQMDLFERSIRKHLSPKLGTQLSQHLANSIFMFSTGNNDFLGNYFGSSSDTRQRYNPQQFTQLLIDGLSLNLKKLYELGARKVVVFDLGPLGCLESMVRRFKPNGRCDENINEIVLNYNSQIASMLDNLTSTLQQSHFIIGHAYSLAYDSIINPSAHGLVDSKNSCCKTLGNGTLTCIPLLEPCSNPNQHFFWDGSHPTEAILSVIASRCINGSSVCLPLNIQQLVEQV